MHLYLQVWRCLRVLLAISLRTMHSATDYCLARTVEVHCTYLQAGLLAARRAGGDEPDGGENGPPPPPLSVESYVNHYSI